MAKEIKIFPVEQYIIDQVRKIRKALGITADQLSKAVSLSDSIGLVGNIESSAMAATYTDHNLNIIAKVFTEQAKKLKGKGVKKDYTVYDFYPKVPLNDTPIIKTNVKDGRAEGPTKSLYKVIGTDFLDEARSARQITDFSNGLDNTDRKPSSFTSPLFLATDKGVLERIELKEGNVLYRKPKKD
ncbi:hypothetical protein [Pedobacter hartonius]|uniref:Uncharacterized protein n=1 Tax=Pedobacter hartonius TaxID=425514 RepID=A0A1H4G5Z2_9SPHI|nr:hypothetical protein [Pedobacter hartonius]SEB05036.1 hypothetical protein SAMN05443550_10962 [Pedobacter hartonius]